MEIDTTAPHISGFFKDIKYFQTGELDEQVSEVLSLCGAKKTAYLSGSNTHCIVGKNPEYNDINEATDMLDVPAATQDWVLASVFCKKHLPLKAFSPAENRLFQNCHVCIGQMSLPGDVDKIWALVTFNGGKVTKELSKCVTHYVTERPGGPDYEAVLQESSMQPVSPDWITDSVKSGARCSEALYHPRLLKLPENLPKPAFKESPKPEPANQTTEPPKPELGKLATQASKLQLGAATTRLPGPPQIPTQRLPGPPQLSFNRPPAFTNRPQAAGVMTRPGSAQFTGQPRPGIPGQPGPGFNQQHPPPPPQGDIRPGQPSFPQQNPSIQQIQRPPAPPGDPGSGQLRQQNPHEVVDKLHQGSQIIAKSEAQRQMMQQRMTGPRNLNPNLQRQLSDQHEAASQQLRQLAGQQPVRPQLSLGGTVPSMSTSTVQGQTTRTPELSTRPQMTSQLSHNPPQQQMPVSASMQNNFPQQTSISAQQNQQMTQQSTVIASQASMQQPSAAQNQPFVPKPVQGQLNPQPSSLVSSQSMVCNPQSGGAGGQQNTFPGAQPTQGMTVQRQASTDQQQMSYSGNQQTPGGLQTSVPGQQTTLANKVLLPGQQALSGNRSGPPGQTAATQPQSSTFPSQPNNLVAGQQQTSVANQQTMITGQQANMPNQQAALTGQQGNHPNQQTSMAGQQANPPNQQPVMAGQQANMPSQPAGMAGQQAGLQSQQAGMANQQANMTNQQLSLTSQATSLPSPHTTMIGQQPGMSTQQRPMMPQPRPMMGQQMSMMSQQNQNQIPNSSQMVVSGQQIINRPQMVSMQGGAQLVTVQGSQQVSVQGGVRLQGQHGQDQGMMSHQSGMRPQGPGQVQSHPAILQQHEQLRLQQQNQRTQQLQQLQPGQQTQVRQQLLQGRGQTQHLQQAAPGQLIQQGQGQIVQQSAGVQQQQGQQWNQDSGQFVRPQMQSDQSQPVIQSQQQQQWPSQQQQMMQQQQQQQQQQGVQQQGMQPRMIGPGQQRPMTPQMQRQQHIIQRHITQLTPEQRQQFSQMNPKEKQQYLAQRGLLLANPSNQWGPTSLVQRHTIQLTEQQRQLLQNMNPQDRSLFIQKLQKERESQIRAQLQLQQQQMIAQQQQQQGQQQQVLVHGQQQQPQQHMMPQPQQPTMAQQQQQQALMNPQQGSTQWQTSPVHSSPQPASPLHQMSPGHESPGTAGQIRPSWSGETHPALAQVPRTPQQIQHLQRLQIQRQQMGEAQNQNISEQVSAHQQQTQMSPQSTVTMAQQQGLAGQQHVMIGPNGQSQTKVALQNMLSSRLGPGGQPIPAGNPQQTAGMSGDSPAAAGRLQMMNQQLQPSQQHIMQQQQMLAMQQRNNALRNVTNSPQHSNMMGGINAQHFGQRGVVPGVIGMRPQVPGLPQPRLPPQFVGHAIETRLPPDLCLLGCIFVVADYQENENYAKFVASWKKTITQYGGEIEDALSTRVTHLLCSSQKSALAQQARVEGKRLVTAFWLNDTVKRKKVLPPWKAIHFPLPSQFEPPCTNMILTLTGFLDRDRDYVKEMIKIVGAKYTSYFTKHNHAIICKAPIGEKFDKARQWKVPAVSIQWLNDVMFGSVNAAQCMSNVKYQGFKSEEPLRIDYNLVPHLVAAWKIPIRITPETYQKFKANPPARIKRKAEKQRQEREVEEKRRKLNDERAAQGLPPVEPGCLIDGESDLDPVTGLPVPKPKPQVPPNSQEKENEAANKVNKVEPMDEDVKDAESEKENLLFQVSEEKPKIMFSNMEKEERIELNHLLTDMYSEYTTVPGEVTHLIMPSLERTNNFLIALPTIKYLLKPDWIRASKIAGKWLPEEDFRVKDTEFDDRFNCNISVLLENPDRNKIFNGKVFYVTPSVQPSMKIVIDIIQAAGGRLENRRRKTPQQIKELNKGGILNYIIITCTEDLHLITDVLRAKQPIFTSEFVLSAVLHCEMDFDISKYMTTVSEDAEAEQ